MSEIVEWTNCEWLDPKKVADWFEDRVYREYGLEGDAEGAGLATLEGGGALCRAIYRWRHEGRLASVYAVDRHLTRFGWHISEIPSECWTDEKPRSKRGPQLREKEKIRIAAKALTAPKRHVAKEHGVTERSIRNWLSQYAEEIEEYVSGQCDTN